MKQLVTICFLFFASILNGQELKNRLDSLRYKATLVENSIEKQSLRNSFHLDSIKIKTKEFKNKIEAVCKFEQSKQKLLMDVYFDQSDIFLVLFKEKSDSKFKMCRETYFYFEDDELSDESIITTIPAVLSETGGINIESMEKEFFNSNWDVDFLKRLFHLIVDEVSRD